MAIVRVQSTSAVSAGAATSLALTLGAAPTNGNFLVAVITTTGTTANRVSSISQTGATWVKSHEVLNNMSLEIWYAENVSGAATGITINYAASVTSSAVVVEYSGIATSSSIDQTASNSGTYPGTADSGTTATTSQANELWFAGLADNQAIGVSWNAPSNSFTEIVESNNIGIEVVAEERIVSSTGTANTAAAHSIAPLSGDWCGIIATFKEATATRRVFIIS